MFNLLSNMFGPAVPETVTFVETDEARSIIDRDGAALILDVRSPGEYASGHIPGATLVPIDQLANYVGELAEFKERPVLVYCHTHNRASHAAALLDRHGFADLTVIRNGIIGWMGRRYPMERSN